MSEMEQKPKKTPLTGSCHCGETQYIVYLTLPHPHDPKLPPPSKGVQRIYRCNCTVCHKFGQMHVRPAAPADDFLLLSPLDPFSTLGDYLCYDKVLHFFFCKMCGGRCFIFAGDGELVDVDLSELGLAGLEDKYTEKVVKAWKPKTGGGHPELGHYLSVNAHSIDANQDGFDMREWTEKKYVMYCDCLSNEADEVPATYERPQHGGCY